MKIRMNLYLGGLLIGNWLAMNSPAATVAHPVSTSSPVVVELYTFPGM
jgi:hypothetical protein